MPKKLEYYRRPNRGKKCWHHIKRVALESGGLQTVPTLTTKGRVIADADKANKKQCIVLGQMLQAPRDAEPFVLDNLLKAIDEVKKLLTVYDVKDKNVKICEAVHIYMTLGGVILILVEIALKAIEAYKEGDDLQRLSYGCSRTFKSNFQLAQLIFL